MFKQNYWPHTIVLMIIGVVIASYFTIKVAIETPVQDSNLFLTNYHITDKNINDILRSQIAFNSKYRLDYSESQFSEDRFQVKLKVLSGDDEVDARLTSVVTRPDIGKFDQTFDTPEFQYQLPKKGRWHIYVKADVESLTGYFYLEVDSRDVSQVKVLNPFVSHKRIENINNQKQERINQLLKESGV